ncbi:MAG: YitT family protein [Bacteroidetes bacterium]|nr:MAG: YitT family protein [Bacteroidota bacterium]
MNANGIFKKKLTTSEILQDAAFMIAGSVVASFALKSFLVPNNFFDGGVTGISLLVHHEFHLNLALMIIAFNLPLVLVSYFSVGKSFAVKMFLAVVLLGVSLQLLPEYALTKDKLLISIFGGVFLGIGIGLVMRAGTALDGIEVLALFTLKRTSFTISEIILAINVLIFTIAGIGIGIENALYSILTYFCATRCIDYVVEGLQAYTGVTIISGKSEEIKHELVNNLGRGITVYKGERGFLPGNFEVSADCDIIFTVITRLELRKLNNLVHEVDPKAFVFANTIKEASGGILKRRHKH